jgi:threonine/homoserine/homoserine lactone efflux protein
VLSPATLAAFVPAVLAVVVAPGPDTVYTLTRSLGSGRAAGVAAGLGTASGVLVHTAAAALGLSALLRASATAHAVVTSIGAAYLCYLGVRTLWREGGFAVDPGERDGRLWRSYREAVAVNVSNPKVALFVLAVFPGFVPPGANVSLQLSLLGVVYAGLSLAYLGGVALFAARLRGPLVESARNRRVLRCASGVVLVGFGAALALDGLVA